ncbi:MAG TPA: ATP synthase F0 subunit C [bacterium]|nr:ATP synthase F0 subunit C [bacterium]
MTPSIALAFALPLGLAITALGSALSLGRAVAAAMDATARQPEASTKVLVNMMAGCALIEALTLYALVFGFSLMGKI